MEIVIEGTLKPDGTLELDKKPALAPGRVTVVLRQDSTASPQALGEQLFETLRQIRAGQKARGHVPRSEAEIQAQRDELQQEMEEELKAAEQLQLQSRDPRRSV